MSVHAFEETFDVSGVSPEACFAYITDPAHGTEWNTIARGVEAHGDPGVGRELAIDVGLLGITFHLPTTVTAWEEPARYRIEGQRPFPSALEARFAPVPGGTRATCGLQAEPGRFFPVGGRLLAMGLRRQFDSDMKRLRTHLAALAT